MQSSVTVCFLLLVFPVDTHVVKTFEVCKKYFYNNHVPTWTSNNHVHICQVFENSYRFATLYDTANRIPVYSAYVIESGKTSEHRWMVEPQLVKDNFEKGMMTKDSLIYKHPELKPNPGEIGRRQATDEDYKGLPKGYNRGHLNPNSHHAGDAAKATYTLTNIVPQNQNLNKGTWKDHEDELLRLANGNSVYVLVGAIPSKGNWIKINNEPRVNIPDYMWVAYCYCDKKSCKSGGATAKNTENKIYKCTLSELQKFLQDHKLQGDLFDKKCYVTQDAGASAAAGNPCAI